MGKKDDKNKDVIDKIRGASRLSRLGWIGGIKGRIIIFFLALLLPIAVGGLIFSCVIIILAGTAGVIIENDPDIKAGSKSMVGIDDRRGGLTRRVEVPEHLKGKMFFPAGTTLTSKQGHRWGRMHYGIDLAGNYGGGVNDVLPVYPGEVYGSGWNDSYGNYVSVKHDIDGTILFSFYAHFKELKVKKGDFVGYNTPLGIMGTTGNSTGIHVHLELHNSAYVFGASNYVRTSSPLQVTDYLYCSDTKVIPNQSSLDVTECMKYRFSQT